MRSILRNQALLVFLAAILLLASSCGSENSIDIHNPLTGELKVVIDDKEYVLPSRATRQLKLSKGPHKVKSTLDGKVLIDSTFEISSDHKSAGCMINVSGESMYQWTEMYGSEMESKMYSGMQGNNPRLDSIQAARYEQTVGKTMVVMIDSTVIIGPVIEYPATQLVIKKTWRFGIDTPFPQQIEEKGSGSFGGKGISKLFTKDDMRAYWASEYGSMMKESLGTDD